MPDQHEVKIISWPKQKALLEHYFKLDEPCPVAIIFDEKPAHVEVTNVKEKPLHVNMQMHLKAREDIPLCIKICEPICAKSDYRIDITLFGQPLAEIGVRGMTRLEPCKPGSSDEKKYCQVYRDKKHGQAEASPYKKEIVTYTTNSGDPVTWRSFLTPPVTSQMVLPDSGLRISFDHPVSNVELEVVNFGNPVIQVSAYHEGTQIFSTNEVIDNEREKIAIASEEITIIELRGGSNEAGIIEVCYYDAVAKEEISRAQAVKIISNL